MSCTITIALPTRVEVELDYDNTCLHYRKAVLVLGTMTIQLLAVILLCLHPDVIHPYFLDITDDIVRNLELRWVLLVLDDPDSLGNLRRDVFRKLKVQSKVIFKSDIEQMQNLGSVESL